MRRSRIAVSLWLLAGCAAPEFATFEPLPANYDGERIARGAFSIAVPRGFVERGTDAGSKELAMIERPPANGRHRYYRFLDVVTLPPFAAAPEAVEEHGLPLLRERYRDDELVEVAHGRARIADRDCVWLEGRVTGQSAGADYEVLAFFVPGADGSLAIAFKIGRGQLAAARAGFEAVAQSLQTTLRPPLDPRGELQWLLGGRIGLRLGDVWRASTAADDKARFELAEGRGHCEVSAMAAGDIGAVEQAYLGERRAADREFAIIRRDLGRRDGRQWVRVCTVRRDGGEALVEDTTWVAGGGRCERVQFSMALADYRRNRNAIDGTVRSIAWR